MLMIQKNTDLVPSQAKFNSWKLITPTYKKDSPGNIYKDESKIFEFFSLAQDYNKESYGKTVQKLKEDDRILYIFVNINGECETAQNKYPVVRVMPGILIPCDVYKEYVDSGLLKSKDKAGAFIFNEFDPIEYKNKEYYLLFNINQSTFLHKKAIGNIKTYFALHRKYYLTLRQALAADFSKQGLDLFKANR